MRPIYPGQFHSVRRNTWNLVFVLDLASVPSLDVIATTASTLIQRGVPFRFGFVPMTTPGVDDMCAYQAYGSANFTDRHSKQDGKGILVHRQGVRSRSDKGPFTRSRSYGLEYADLDYRCFA
jgi:hypothetical protein